MTLTFADRYRRRLTMTDDRGEPFLLDLDQSARLADGDGLALMDGGIIAVRAADESVVDVAGTSAADTARLAWHLGNRHAPLQVLPDGALRLQRDPVLEAMLERLGARLEAKRAPFDPEAGAYAEHRHGRPTGDTSRDG